ncbi:MAG TPA: carboxypeptidase-like regulatory domain-containing protein [Gemmatimonadaceae bacterium]|nr:carboxypeptidase-like regulatory domain-containing protein [Gemmatimonadaceae bacterium]
MTKRANSRGAIIRAIACTVAAVLVCGAALAGIATRARAQGAGSIEGRVVDVSGRPIGGARITLDSSARRAQSELDGRFVFRQLPPGTHRLDVRRLGYQPATIAVDVTDRTIRPVITLSAIPQLLDSVRIAERARGLSYSAVVLDDFAQPVLDAQVVVPGSSGQIRTDSAGRFRVRAEKAGTLMLRLRKLGYRPVLTTLRLVAAREDTLRMSRIAQTLPAAEVVERSGFGRDTFVYRDLEARMRWKETGAGVISREELDAQGRASLCDALPHTPTGTRLGLRPTRAWCGPGCILVNGDRLSIGALTTIFADQVEAVEYYPSGSDWSGTMALRCGGETSARRDSWTIRQSRSPGGFVVWLRDSLRTKTP